MAKEYEIARPSGACAACGRALAGGEEFTAVLVDGEEQFQRADYCAACWETAGGRGGEEVFSVWQSRMPTPDQPSKPVLNTQALVQFFERLSEADEPGRVNFRFVLGLMLMRKKLLVYDRSDRDEQGRETWTMHYRSDQRTVRVIRPELSDQQIAEVGAQLGQVFEVAP